MDLCDICKINRADSKFNPSNPDISYHRTLPRVRSDLFYFCDECSYVLGDDRHKYRQCDKDTRLILGEYDPLPRRFRLIYRELSLHKDIDKIIAEYSVTE